MKYAPAEMQIIAKEKGFLGSNLDLRDEYCFKLCEIQRWLREKHNIHISVFCDYDIEDKTYDTSWNVNIINLKWGQDKEHHVEKAIRKYYKIYEEALEKGIEEALKLIKNKK